MRKFSVSSLFCILIFALNTEGVLAQTQAEPRREFSAADAKSIGLSSDGHWLLMGSNKEINIYHTRTGLQVRQFTIHTNTVTSIATSPRKRVAVSGDEQGNILLWNIDDLSIVQRYEGQKGAVKSLRFSKDGLQFSAVVGSKNTVCLFDLIQNKPLAKTEKGMNEVNATEIQDGKNQILTAHDNGTVAVWNLADSFKIAKTNKLHEGRVTSVRLIKNGMATASDDKTLRIWDANGKMKKSFVMDSGVRTMDVSMDQKTAVLVLESGRTVVVDLATGFTKFSFFTKADAKESVYHPTEPIVVSLYADNKARSWILR